MIFLLGLLTALIIVFLPLLFTAPIIIAIFGILIGLMLFNNKKELSQENAFLINIFLLSFIVRIAASLLFYNSIFLHDGVGLSGDALGYSENGYSIIKMWLSGIRDIKEIAYSARSASISGTLGSYDFWNAIVYYFTGKSPLSVIFINCLVSSLTIFFIYYSAKQLYSEKAAKVSAMLTAFWPSLFIWSIQDFKEPLSIFLMAILIWVILRLKVKFRFYLLFLLILASIALKELREESFYMFYAVIFPFSLILFLWKKNRVLFIFLILSAGAVLFAIINNYLNDRSILEYINYMRTARAYGNTAFMSNLDITNPISFIFFVPAALLVAWLAPFPWQMGSLSQITAMPEMAAYYLLLPSMFLGCGFVMRHKIREGGLVIVYIFIMMLVLAFIEGNIGTLFRHRAMVLPFMFILIGIGLDRRRPEAICDTKTG